MYSRPTTKKEEKNQVENLIIGGWIGLCLFTCQHVGRRNSYGRSQTKHLGDDAIEQSVDLGEEYPGRSRRGYCRAGLFEQPA